MARKSRMSILKRQRELKRAEKAARKRARRQGKPLEPAAFEPRPTVDLLNLGADPDGTEDKTNGSEADDDEQE